MTNPLERWFTLASRIDHMEFRAPGQQDQGFFQPDTNAHADVTELSNLALADLRPPPPQCLPRALFKFDASSLPVCLVTSSRIGLQRHPDVVDAAYTTQVDT